MSSWNGNRFSVYTSEEKSVLGLIKEMGDQTNYNSDEIVRLTESDNKKVSHQEMQEVYKIDKQANFTGSWFGIKRPTQSSEGLTATVEQLIDETIPDINSQLEQKADKTYIDNELFKIVKPNDDLVSVMKSTTKPLKLLDGVFIINEPLPFNVPFEGVSQQNTTIRPSDSFVGDYLIDFNKGSERKYIKNINIDGNWKNIKAFGSSNDASGSSSSLFEGIYFTRFNDYVLDSSSVGTVSGMLTGSTFLNCSFNGNKNLLKVGNNQDDVNFTNCRFNLDGVLTSDCPFIINGANIKFDCCYFSFSKCNYEVGGIKPMINIGGKLVVFTNCFFEDNNDLTNYNVIFHCNFPNSNLVLNGIHLNIKNNTFRSLIRYGIGSTSESANFYLNSFTKTTMPNSNLIEIFNGVNGLKNNLVSINFSNANIFNNIIKEGDGGYSIRGLYTLNGSFKGENFSVATRETIITDSLANSATVTSKVNDDGIYFLNVISKITNDKNHAIIGNYILTFFNGVYKVANLTQIGTSQKTNTDITISNLSVTIDTGGTLTITTTYTGTYAIGIDIKLTKISSI